MSLSRSVVLVVLCAGAVCAQNVISAKSGLIHYVEGVVRLDGTEVVKKSTADFPAMKEGSELRAEMGRAEILLSPGVFLRVAENSSFRLVSNDLLDTRLALTSGSVLIEVSEAEKNQSLSMTVGESKLDLSHRGLYRIDFDPAQIRVFDGSAVVLAGGQQVTVKEGKLANLNGVIAQSKFNKEDTDAFYRWASRRSGYIASANLAAAKRTFDRGGSSMGMSDWMWNPYFGMFTYVPYRGMYRSPFGYSYYSPGTIANVYYRPVYNPPSNSGWNGGMSSSGMSTMSDRGSMASYGSAASSPSVVSAPSMSSAPAASMGSGGGSHASAGSSGGGGGGGRSGGR